MRGVIAPLLIVRAAVGRTEIKRIVGRVVRLEPEGDADEATGTRVRVRRRRTCELYFDHSVREFEVFDGCELFDGPLRLLLWRQPAQLVPGLLRQRQAQTFLALESHGLG